MGACVKFILLIGVSLLTARAGAPVACAPDDSVALRSFLAALPSAELVSLGELVGAKPPDAEALVEELACSIAGDRRDLLRYALAELGHPPAHPQRRTEDSGHGIHGPGTTRPFIYFLQIGEESRLRGVSTALLCLLLQGLTAGPSPQTDAGVATCYRFGRYCQSWEDYHPGTRVEMWMDGGDPGAPKQWQAGTVLQSNVKRRNTGQWASQNSRASPSVLLNVAGTMTVEIDGDLGVVEVEIPGHIVRHLVDDDTGTLLVRFWEWSHQDQIHFFEHELMGADFVLNPMRLGSDMLAPGRHIKGEGFVGSDGGGELVYITVLRNPLDAVVARFFAAHDRDLLRARVVRDIKSLAGLPPCPFALAGAACWDTDYYTQSLADPGLCDTEASRREGGQVCSDESEEEAVRRV